jgi:dCTP deaminase
MILSDRDMKMFMSCGAISVAPTPRDEAFSSTSLDLRLDDELRSFRSDGAALGMVLDPAARDYVHQATMDRLTLVHRIGPSGFELKPQAMVLGWTRERIDLDVMSRVAARVEGKSSLARIGLGIHITAPTIHSGFRGAIQLEIVNHGPLPIRLRRGMKICQLIFEQTLSVPERGYQGRFLGQGAGMKPEKGPAAAWMRKGPVRSGTGPYVPRAVPGGA